ncbi:uncharacterized protein LOC116352132 [Contarinia nasturtii]|uniref:uncharacterized protein LOC116352132 n=1 Tax=Contarinia nasturtii TaxID=265458 RepID=UPI0012D381C6|nr:uncharacterized protein LOC116352132 [Contarinia nasturtii]
MFNRKCVILMVVITCVIWAIIDAAPNKKENTEKSKGKNTIDSASQNEYETFSVKNKKGKVIAEYSIRDIPELRCLDVIKLFNDYYLRDEPLNQLLGNVNNKDSFTDKWIVFLAQGENLGCFDTKTNELVGVLFGFAMEKQEKKPQKKSNENPIISSIFNFDVCDYFKVEKYMSISALVVHPNHRKRGIAEHLLSNTREICKKLKLPLVSGVFTSDGSNKAAQKVGFNVTLGTRYDKLAAKYEDLRYLKGAKDKEINRRTIRYPY